MKIFRGETEIELSEQELQDAHLEQERIYRFQDARGHLEDYVGTNKRGYLNKSGFYLRYGFRFDEAIDPKSEHYLLEEIVGQYEKCSDCNIAENDMFEKIVRHVLEEHKVPRTKACMTQAA